MVSVSNVGILYFFFFFLSLLYYDGRVWFYCESDLSILSPEKKKKEKDLNILFFLPFVFVVNAFYKALLINLFHGSIFAYVFCFMLLA